MSELEVLGYALWTFGVTSFVTFTVSVILVWSMWGQEDQSPVGRWLRWYYACMAPLSLVKGTLFAYYGSRQSGGPEWLPDDWRIVLLLAGSAVSVALDIISILLVAAYFRERTAATEPEHPP